MTENLLVSLNDIEEKEASWLVPQRMPKGQIIILAGDGGSGKTSCWWLFIMIIFVTNKRK